MDDQLAHIKESVEIGHGYGQSDVLWLIAEVEQFRGLIDRLELDQRERGADIMRMQAWAKVQDATILERDEEIKRLKASNGR